MKQYKIPLGPFVFSQPTIRKKHFIILLLLTLQIIAITISKDYMALLNIIMSTLAVLCADLVYQKLNKEKLKLELVTLTTGIIIGLCLPNSCNYISVWFLVFISFFISKLIFGGNGSNWVNPVVVTICISYISSVTLFPKSLNTLDLIRGTGSIFSVLQTNVLQKIQSDQYITSMLNSFFQHLGVIIPDGYVTLLTKYTSTIPAFRYNLLTILSSIVLITLNIIDKTIPIVFLLTYGILVWLFSMLPINDTIANGDILVAWCTSGILFYTFFIMPDTASTPNTTLGKILFAILTAIFAFLICGPGASGIGTAFSILLGNICTPLISSIECSILQYKLRKNYGH